MLVCTSILVSVRVHVWSSERRYPTWKEAPPLVANNWPTPWHTSDVQVLCKISVYGGLLCLRWTARKKRLRKEKMLVIIEWTNPASQYGSTLHHVQFQHCHVFYPCLGPEIESVSLKNGCFAYVCCAISVMKMVKLGSFRLGAIRDGNGIQHWTLHTWARKEIRLAVNHRNYVSNARPTIFGVFVPKC